MYMDFYRKLMKEAKVPDDNEHLKEHVKKNAELQCKNEFLSKEKEEVKSSRSKLASEVETLKRQKANLLKEMKVFESEAKDYDKRIEAMKVDLKESEEMYKIAAKIIKSNAAELEQKAITRVTKRINEKKKRERGKGE